MILIKMCPKVELNKNYADIVLSFYSGLYFHILTRQSNKTSVIKQLTLFPWTHASILINEQKLYN